MFVEINSSNSVLLNFIRLYFEAIFFNYATKPHARKRPQRCVDLALFYAHLIIYTACI